MKLQIVICVISILTIHLNMTNGAHILATFPFTSKSHTIFYNGLFYELARRGHHVTVISSYSSGVKIDNLEEIIFPRTLETQNMFEMKEKMKGLGFISSAKKMIELSCHNSLNNSKVEPFIKGEKPVDLVISTGFFGDCHLGFIYVYKNAPFMQMIPLEAWHWRLLSYGNPLELATVPDIFLGFTQDMSLKERIFNVFSTLGFVLFQKIFLIPLQEEIMHQYFGPDVPPVNDLLMKSSLFLMNTDIALGNARAFSSNIIPVGGMHIVKSMPLPQELKKWLDEATNGVIYFSLGSNVRSIDMPKDKLEALLNTFKKFKQKVLWKWEEDKLPGQPSNVRIGKWLPQSDLLSHPNIKLFITHGGLLSNQEAVYHGIPLIGIPVMADQLLNMRRTVSKGFGILMEFENITERSMTWAIEEILNNPSYKENAQQLSNIFRDRPMNPLDTAVFWTEYVIRHKGAPHLSNPAKYLYWFQRELWDIYFILLSVSSLIIYIVIRLLKKLFSICRKTKKTKKE